MMVRPMRWTFGTSTSTTPYEQRIIGAEDIKGPAA